MDFWKLHGAGNDFILIDNRNNEVEDLPRLAKAVCDRHKGVGADGLMGVGLSDIADVRMHFYNADGSLAAMCGNGIRCFSKYVRDKGIVEDSSFTVETGDGVKSISLSEETELTSIVRVEMGNAGEMQALDLSAVCRGLQSVFLKVGVPHTMLFLRDANNGLSSFSDELIALTEKYGPVIEKAPVFPEGTNVNFVSSCGKDRLLVSTWERGAGRTLACGTGACASAAAAFHLGMTGPHVRVRMPGGEVSVTIADDGALLMEGEARLVCKGFYYPSI